MRYVVIVEFCSRGGPHVIGVFERDIKNCGGKRQIHFTPLLLLFQTVFPPCPECNVIRACSVSKQPLDVSEAQLTGMLLCKSLSTDGHNCSSTLKWLSSFHTHEFIYFMLKFLDVHYTTSGLCMHVWMYFTNDLKRVLAACCSRVVKSLTAQVTILLTLFTYLPLQFFICGGKNEWRCILSFLPG